MPVPVPTGAAVELLERLRAAALLQGAVSEALRGSELTVDRWRCLAQVARRPGASMSDLAEVLVMAPATASRAVDGLVDLGLLYRGLDPAGPASGGAAGVGGGPRGPGAGGG